MTVDPQLLGGLVVQVNDEVIDGSVLSRLAEVRHAAGRLVAARVRRSRTGHGWAETTVHERMQGC